MTIQIKAIEQYFPVVLFFMLYEVVLTFEPVMKSFGVTIQMKATEQYFPVVVFIMLYKVAHKNLLPPKSRHKISNPRQSSDRKF